MDEINIFKGFNTPIEIGTRVTLILTAIENKASLDDLVMLDYALLYSQEFGGPENLHPALPNHIAEITHRREFMPKAIQFFLERGLIELLMQDSGYFYQSNDSTLDFVSCLQSSYYKKAWKRLSWISENRIKITNTNVIGLVKS
ncbi:hypothetical protein AB835_13925 [Candidatus Endobugula sertula]|uniref:Uncharacterized protein n=1 Tax=Candidatus Endobugula sertula TaxID=62101 RepID=A0A1D2QLM7_9GAMM|nr:hypothetical protein AB835_13925 [Candidatus Endobugula sertula]